MEHLEVRFLGDLQRLQPQPGDVYVLSTEHRVDMASAERIEAVLQLALGADAKVLVLDGGSKLGVIGQQQCHAPVLDRRSPEVTGD